MKCRVVRSSYLANIDSHLNSLTGKHITRKTIQRILVGAGLLAGGHLGHCLKTFKVETTII
jgi:hypothetical protein